MKILSILLNKFLPQNIAFAHCDIPCGIYDPNNAQRAAHTIIRMTELFEKIKRDDETKAEHDIARVTHVKEEHSNILEEELSTLKDDYFKEEHFKSYPNLNELFEKASKASTKTRQGIDIKSAEEVLEYVLEIAEIFYKTKGVESVRVKSIYPTEREFVTHK